METSDSYELLKSRASSISEGLTPGDAPSHPGTEYETAGCSTRLLEAEGRSPGPPTTPRNSPSCVCSASFRNTPLPLVFRPAEVTFVHWNWPAIRLFCLLAAGSTAFAVVCVVLGLLFGIKADCLPPDEWWRGALMYEVFPASFQDTDGDGFGDMRGLLQRLGHVRRLGARAVRLNSIFGALDYPLEYEHVIDFRNVDPHLGRLEQMERLVRECHSRDLRVILDINPTVTSDQHTWAAHWLLGKYPEYEGFYINGTEAALEDEFYPEQTTSSEVLELELPQRLFGNQLLLNWSNPEVQREMASVLKFWLRKGVDGFYLKHLDRMRVRDDHELFHVIRQWRRLADIFAQEEGRGRVVLMCSLNFLQALQHRHSLLLPTIVGYFDLVDVTLDLTLNTTGHVLSSVLESVDHWVHLEGFPTINWNLGSVETFRLASRMGPGYEMASMYLLMMLPGSATIFYGDEIGLQDSTDIATHKVFRSGQLCPMLWEDANFTDASSSWLPASHWSNTSVSVDRLAEVVTWRNRTSALRTPDSPLPRRLNYRLLLHSDGLVALERFFPRHNRLLICANFAPDAREVDLSGHMHNARIRLASSGRTNPETFNRITLDPGESIIAEVTE